MEDLIASSSPRALLASYRRWAASEVGTPLLGPGVSAVGEEADGISSREASSISASSGVLTWDDVATAQGKTSSLVGRGVTRTMGSSLFDVCPDVSNPTQDRSSLTSIVILTSPFAFSRGALMGLAIRMEEEWLPGGNTLSFGPPWWIVECPLLVKWVCLQAGLCLFGQWLGQGGYNRDLTPIEPYQVDDLGTWAEELADL